MENKSEVQMILLHQYTHISVYDLTEVVATKGSIRVIVNSWISQQVATLSLPRMFDLTVPLVS